MAKSEPETKNVWRALDGWAGTLKPWQRVILAHAIKSRSLGNADIDEVYELLLEEYGLKESQSR
jgi:hypothetical protein